MRERGSGGKSVVQKKNRPICDGTIVPLARLIRLFGCPRRHEPPPPPRYCIALVVGRLRAFKHAIILCQLYTDMLR